MTPSSQFAALVAGIPWEHLPLGNRAIKRYLERTFEEECLDYKERVSDGAGCAQSVKFTPNGALCHEVVTKVRGRSKSEARTD